MKALYRTRDKIISDSDKSEIGRIVLSKNFGSGSTGLSGSTEWTLTSAVCSFSFTESTKQRYSPASTRVDFSKIS